MDIWDENICDMCMKEECLLNCKVENYSKLRKKLKHIDARYVGGKYRDLYYVIKNLRLMLYSENEDNQKKAEHIVSVLSEYEGSNFIGSILKLENFPSDWIIDVVGNDGFIDYDKFLIDEEEE